MQYFVVQRNTFAPKQKWPPCYCATMVHLNTKRKSNGKCSSKWFKLFPIGTNGVNKLVYQRALANEKHGFSLMSFHTISFHFSQSCWWQFESQYILFEWACVSTGRCFNEHGVYQCAHAILPSFFFFINVKYISRQMHCYTEKIPWRWLRGDFYFK